MSQLIVESTTDQSIDYVTAITMAQKSLEVLGGGLGQSLHESETYPRYALRHTGIVKKTYECA